MALLEKLEPGNLYLLKISASNQVGNGPFSNVVELALKRGNAHRSKNPRHSDSFPDTTGNQHETLGHTVRGRCEPSRWEGTLYGIKLIYEER